MTPHESGSALLIRALYGASLAAAEPAATVRRVLTCENADLYLQDQHIHVGSRLCVGGAGKAAVAMARGVESICGDLISSGLIITKDGHAAPPLPKRIAVTEAAHPIPDERGVAATVDMLRHVERLDADDVFLALISGGGSALLEAPRPPVTLAGVARTTDLLLRAGAPIEDLNSVRIPLSLVKGGGLLRAARPARVLTLILSDVLGNDPSVIASGPTVPGTASGQAALDVLNRYRLVDRVPASVIGVLTDSNVRSVRSEACDAEGLVVIVADNALAVEAGRAEVERRGLETRIVWSARTGEAAELGEAWVKECIAAPADVAVLFGGGEATVTVRGDGVGGRNTEFALAASLAMERLGVYGWTVASLATDGQDGLTGVAGAIADAETAVRSRAGGVDPEDALRENDSLRVFERAGGIVAPGPTGTNVNDLYIAVRDAAI